VCRSVLIRGTGLDLRGLCPHCVHAELAVATDVGAAAFYASPDLQRWTRVGEFARDDLGLLECPDIFEMTADDGSTHWVLGVSANARHRDLPATYAYWTGAFDGADFIPDAHEPRWLDWGFDFYGAVTYPHHAADGREDPGLRHVIGWANFWDYPHNTPTLVTDGYNGDDMIVRDLRLVRRDGGYHLASSPTAALGEYSTATHEIGDIRVEGIHELAVHSLSFELSCEIEWDPAQPPEDLGIEVCRAQGGSRHVDVGIRPGDAVSYLDRRLTINPTAGRTSAALGDADGRMAIRLLVDRTSVELFVGDGRVVHSHRVFPLAGDDGIRLYSHGGGSVFRDLRVHELSLKPAAAADVEMAPAGPVP